MTLNKTIKQNETENSFTCSLAQSWAYNYDAIHLQVDYQPLFGIRACAPPPSRGGT